MRERDSAEKRTVRERIAPTIFLARVGVRLTAAIVLDAARRPQVQKAEPQGGLTDPEALERFASWRAEHPKVKVLYQRPR